LESKHLKKLLAGLCIAGLVGGAGLAGCGGEAAAWSGTTGAGGANQKKEQPKSSGGSSQATPAAKPVKSGW